MARVGSMARLDRFPAPRPPKAPSRGSPSQRRQDNDEVRNREDVRPVAGGEWEPRVAKDVCEGSESGQVRSIGPEGAVRRTEGRHLIQTQNEIDRR